MAETETKAPTVAAAPVHHPGGVHHPDGYELVGIVPSSDDGMFFPVEDLHDTVEIDQLHGASVSLERPQNPESRAGIIRGRIIHDFSANLYIFRKDHPKQNRTHIKVALGHTSPTSI